MLRWVLSLFGPRKPAARSQVRTFLPEVEVETESVEIKATGRKLANDWTAEHDNFPVYLLPTGLLQPASQTGRRMLLDDRHWPRVNGHYTLHHEITTRAGLQAGQKVIFKGSILDHEWCLGTVQEGAEGQFYAVNQAVTGILDYKDGRWVCGSCFATAAVNSIRFS